ncbi:hypothetical protein [Aquimarina longa]|uniref:hypothetical protein n=1 Tax=Aquimarina longa TaxID=1080221 RepID=UPI0007830653|nr:hypothetical protein [Aquimarina longa]
MLKGKKIIYILLPVVVFIWGAIIFQVIGAFSDEDPIASNTIEVLVTPIKGKERDKFSLGTIERDPFLGKTYRTKKKEKKSVSKPKIKKSPLVWPSIRFKGVVSGESNTNAIYLMEINGADQFMKLKQTIDNVTLLSTTSNSVKVRYKGKVKNFKIGD